MILHLCERKPLSQDDWHTIRNNLLVVYGKLKKWKKVDVITEEEYVLCHDRLSNVEEVLMRNLNHRRKS